MKALAIAATGMNAQQLNLEVIANNVANINTTGFKRARAEFSDLLYQVERNSGVPNASNQAIVPEGAHVGLGVQTSAVRNLHIQGSLVGTSNKLDLALVGRGWFQIETPDGDTQYTRAGAFNTNAEGQLVTIDGYVVVPGVTFPDETSEVVISRTGQVFARIGDEVELQDLGQLTLANFVNEAGLEPLGDNLFRQTVASGPAIVGVPADPGFAHIQQGYLEASNVDPVKEITDLISAQRAYEMNSKIIQAADEMASVVSKNLR
ncbi:flagellar basal-body rod protein FlgG [Hoeflea sp. YIM 152468]|uniref:flagellar basal-body rod protein FlgG n=1 Tax=Hoeflea sp. YIM 152468 TaxID=3031759 RepID=UPI0023DA144F|nr:flagellar basal-body rod protein FlgG [Hoeflea sp. YIM 152468]MDF1608856.1 flagellar basal-body rod protein FlgG [Hoeflea sp. YIM 152468]